MGKKSASKDRGYITATEWKLDGGGYRDKTEGLPFRRLPFNCCAVSFVPFEDPVCAPDGTVMDIMHAVPYVQKHGKHPVTGEPLELKDLTKLTFHKNQEGAYECPVLNKAFTNSTHIVAVKTTGNVYSHQAIEELCVKPKNWRDLLTDEKFTRKDLVTIQDPMNLDARALEKFEHVKKGHDATADATAARAESNVNQTGVSADVRRVRATPRSRAKRSASSPGVTTPEHAARTPLPGEARSDDAKSHPEKTLYGRRRDRNVFTRTFVMCAILAVTVALLDPNTTSTRFGALVSVARGGSPGEAETISTSCASDARFGAVAGLSPEEWRETSWLFLEAAREANARHAEETNPSSNPNPSRTRGLSSRKLGAKKGVALALIVETRLAAGPDAIAASAARAAFGCDCVKVFDAKTYVALESPPDSSSGAAHVEEADEVEEESLRLRKREAEANARGALQKEVSAFLEKCPRGVAVIADAHRLTPPLLAALMPAVSEGGRFARDGRDVRADGATYVLVAALGEDFAAGEKGKYRVRGEVEYARAAKAELARLWRGEPFASDGNEALLTEAATGSGVTEAFRRRVDFVVPFRVGGSKED